MRGMTKDDEGEEQLRKSASTAFHAWQLNAALTYYTLLLDLYPGEVEEYRRLIDIASLLGRLDDITALIEKAAGRFDNELRYRIMVVVHLYARSGNNHRARAIIDRTNPADLDDPMFGSMVESLFYMQEYHIAHSLLYTRIKSPAAPVHFLLKFLLASFHSGGQSTFEDAKYSLLESLDAPLKNSLYRVLPPHLLSPPEVIGQIKQVLADGDKDGICQFLVGVLFYHHPDVDKLLAETKLPDDRLIFRATSLSRTHRLRSASARAKASNSQYGADGVVRADRRLHEDITKEENRILSLPEHASMKQSIRDTSRIRAFAAKSLTGTAESVHEAEALVEWLQARIERAQPTSVIRLGDGEGAFLTYPEHFCQIQGHDRIHTQRLWWKSGQMTPSVADAARRELEKAIDSADVIGIPAFVRCIHTMFNDDQARTPNQRGVLSVLNYVAQLGAHKLGNKVITSAQAHMDIYGWGLYRRLFAGLGMVNVISCHDLSHVLQKQFGLKISRWYALPPEHKYRGMLGQSSEVESPPVYPDLYQNIANEISANGAGVYLVAAGFIGKLLCHHIRAAGGIALDIGCTADHWKGQATRYYSLNN